MINQGALVQGLIVKFVGFVAKLHLLTKVHEKGKKSILQVFFIY